VSPAFETFVARLYVDEKLRQAFLADAAAVAEGAGLTADEIRAVEQASNSRRECSSRSDDIARSRSLQP
jgi:hypothetical protein